ncbi:tetratricopeptide repeat protein [Streptomyces sp. NPDC051940]|uniref:tetratricopeptide repeat protein n=1 Tax=Streptomyces sp. NPDC051940 TaxID=3155675 RepID=UPI00342D1FE8
MTAMTPDGPARVSAPGQRAIAAQHLAGTAISGDIDQLVVLPPQAGLSARDIEAPPGLSNLPRAATSLFLGRDRALARLRAALTSKGDAAITQAHAVHGLGGVGKSTLALQYAHRYRAEYNVVWWITAESPDHIDASLAALAVRLDPVWAGTAQPAQHTAWALAWLQWHQGWLLIFDNVEDPADLRPYLGTLPGGHHVVTSRRSTGWHGIAPTITLDVLTPSDATSLLCSLAFPGRPPTDAEREEAGRLAAELGHLPLALEQAGAYLHQTKTSCAAYLRALGPLLDEAAEGIDAQRTIARIWGLTLDAITQRNPQAVRLLNALAWFAPDSLPREVLAPLAGSTAELDRALGVLHSYHMITLTRQGLTIHRLLQTVLRSVPRTGPGSSEGPAHPGRTDAERAMAATIPEARLPAEQAWPAWQPLLPHIQALAVATPDGYRSEALGVFMAAADQLRRQGRLGSAVPLCEAVAAQRRLQYGEEHPNTHVSLSNLASSYQAAGDTDRAIPLYERSLAKLAQVFGGDDARTLACRSNLAGAYQAAGELELAIALHLEVLEQRRRLLGEDHADTLNSFDNLAGAYQAAGAMEWAIPLHSAAVEGYRRVLGPGHPRTLGSRNNLASALRLSGAFEEAIRLHRSVLADYEQVLGRDHPDTAACRSNLATAHRAAGEFDRAIPLYEQALEEFERILGADHRYAVACRGNLEIARARVTDTSPMDFSLPPAWLAQTPGAPAGGYWPEHRYPVGTSAPGCPSCAEPLEAGDRFCAWCGADLAWE